MVHKWVDLMAVQLVALKVVTKVDSKAGMTVVKMAELMAELSAETKADSLAALMVVDWVEKMVDSSDHT